VPIQSDLNGQYRPYLLDEVKRNSKKELFTVVSTFSGGGGSSTGYKLAGGKLLVANEVNETAAETYSANYPETPVANIDIRKITRRGGRQYVLDFFANYGVDFEGLDIFDGSPPCTTFSTASAGRGKDKIERKHVKHANVDQSRIGMLIHDYVYLVNCLHPRVFIMENVVPSKNSPVFQDAIERVKKHGYVIGWNSVFATNCGVPQKRERLITVGVRPDVAKSVGIKSYQDILSIYPKPNPSPITVRQALEGLDVDLEEEEILLDSCRLNSSYEILQHIPKDQSKHLKIQDVYPEWKEKFNSEFTLIRAGWDTPSPTLTCRGQQLGIGGIHHPHLDRKFSITEMKRIMSLPDDFILSGSFNDKAERIGNMVPPLMTKALAEAIYEKVLLPSR
jgi:DNA (cytosine-5)-methyltransferase 1